MTRIRPTIKKGEWVLTKHQFYTAYHYALQYNEWKAELNAITFVSAVNNDPDPHGTGIGNPTEIKAMRREQFSTKVETIRALAFQSAPEIGNWLLLAVTNEGATYNYLHNRGMPCGKNYFYERRRKFYYLLSKHLEEGDAGDKNP